MKKWGRVTAVLFRLKVGLRTPVMRNGAREGVGPRWIKVEEEDSTRRLGDSKEGEKGTPRRHEDTKGEVEAPPRREDAKGQKEELGDSFDGAQGGSRLVKADQGRGERRWLCDGVLRPRFARLAAFASLRMTAWRRAVQFDQGRWIDVKLWSGRQKSDKTKPIGEEGGRWNAECGMGGVLRIRGRRIRDRGWRILSGRVSEKRTVPPAQSRLIKPNRGERRPLRGLRAGLGQQVGERFGDWFRRWPRCDRFKPIQVNQTKSNGPTRRANRGLKAWPRSARCSTFLVSGFWFTAVET